MNIHAAIRFIAEYRNIEKGTVIKGQELIREVLLDDYRVDHLCDSWAGRKNDWGDFYLNLSHVIQYEFLKFWGLQNTEGDEYSEKATANPAAMLFSNLPGIIYWPHELLKFFYNHGISEVPAEGIALTVLPSEDKRYGSSANWGDYILSLPRADQEKVLKDIAAYIGDQVPADSDEE